MRKLLLGLVVIAICCGVIFADTTDSIIQKTAITSMPAQTSTVRNAKDLSANSTTYNLAVGTTTVVAIAARSDRERIYIINKSTPRVYLLTYTNATAEVVNNSGLELEGNLTTADYEENKFVDDIYTGAFSLIQDFAEEGLYGAVISTVTVIEIW